MNTSTIGKIISFVLVIALLAGGIGLIYSLTNGFTTGLSPFYVTLGDKDIKDTTKGVIMDRDEPTTIKVNYTLADDAQATSDMYTVKVVPNTDRTKDFDFKVDGDLYAYRAIGELTAGFEIKKEDNQFTIKPKGGIDKILSCAYGGKKIEDAMSNAFTDMYILQISTTDGEHTISIYFSIPEYANDIYLDKEEIIF